MIKTDGGPAFPMLDHTDTYSDRYWGMSLRDWFAGQAVATIIPMSSNTYEKDAEAAYKVADAMLSEREKRHE